MKMRNGLAAAVMLSTSVLSVARAAADTKASASELAERARAAAARGDHAAAVTDYRAALTAAPADDAEKLVYRCGLGLAFQQLGDLTRAHRFLDECAAGDAEVAAVAEGTKALRALRKELVASDALAAVEIITRPDGARVRLSGFEDDEDLIAPHEVWLPLGTYRLEVSAPGHIAETVEVTLRAARRTPVLVSLVVDKNAKPGETTVDFGEETDEGPGDFVASNDPRPKEHPSLLPDRYARGLAAGGGDGADPGVEDGAGAGAAARARARLRFSVRGGVTTSWLDRRWADSSDGALFGPLLAVGVERGVGGGFAIGAELVARRLGQDDELNGNYLEVPVTAWFDPMRDRAASVRAGAGLSVAVAPFDDVVAGVVAMGHVAVGGAWRRVLVDVRFEMGLTEVEHDYGSRTVGGAATLGYRF